MDPMPDWLLKAMLDPINRQPEFDQCYILFHHENEMVMLRPARVTSAEIHLVFISPLPAHGKLVTLEEVKRHEAKGQEEWTVTALSCVGAALGWGSIFGVSFLTGGAGAAPITSLTGAATIASSAQCAVGVGRVYLHYTDPDVNRKLDQSKLYNGMMLGLDVISLVNVASSLSKAGAKTWREYTKQVVKAERMGIGPAIAKLPAEDRAILVERFTKQTGKKLSSKSAAAFLRTGKLPGSSSKAQKATASALRREAQFVVVSQMKQKAMDTAIKEISIEIAKSSPDVAGSAVGGVIGRVPKWMSQDTKFTLEYVLLPEE